MSKQQKDELTQTAASLGIAISPQGLDQRFTQEASECLLQTLESAVGSLISEDAVAIPILQRFNGVYIQDSSVVVLPDQLSSIWSGCGGSSEKNTQASVKLQVRLNMNNGELTGPYLQAGRVNDRSSSLQEKPLPKGALRLADLGYFSLDNLFVAFDTHSESFCQKQQDNLSDLTTQQVYWLSRIFSQCVVIDQNNQKWDLVDLLCASCDDLLDIPVLLGEKKRLPCRLMAVKVAEEVVNERRRRIRADATRRGKTPSQRQLKLAEWTILVTSVPEKLLTLDEAFVLLRVRWQIELLFALDSSMLR